jgi:hypothetical protein
VDAALATAGLPATRAITPIKGFRSRVAEIVHWLKQNPEVAAFVALDDMDLRTGTGGKGSSAIADHFVQTHPTTGLTEADADQAILILGANSTAADTSAASNVVGVDSLDQLLNR